MVNVSFAHGLEQALEKHGLRIRGHINYNSDNIQRFRRAEKGTGKDIFVILQGDRGASFGDWHDQAGWVTWWADDTGREPTMAQRLERDALQREIRKRKLAAREQAEARAFTFWCGDYLTDNASHHPYVIKKRITPYRAKILNWRWVKDVLVIPICNVHHEFAGVQIIKPNGFKRFWKGTSPSHCMVWLSDKLPDNYRGVIRICEGYSTGCSIHEAVGGPVVCALNAHNILLVTAALAKKFPGAVLVICADDDAWTDKNPGIAGALRAMQQTGAMMRSPNFEKFYMGGKPTDFNDLHCLAGIAEVRKQLK